jgi:hypothetical protein
MSSTEFVKQAFTANIHSFAEVYAGKINEFDIKLDTAFGTSSFYVYFGEDAFKCEFRGGSSQFKDAVIEYFESHEILDDVCAQCEMDGLIIFDENDSKFGEDEDEEMSDE